jgi:TetR/AcrR family transcriptional regulator
MIQGHNSQNTEQKIIEVAKHVFMENGLEKAKMQDIADKAGISRSALNYYFRTKENLFSVLIDQLFDCILPAIENLLGNESSFFEKAKSIIEIYDAQLRQNDFIPRFMFIEIQRNPKSIYEYINRSPKIKSYIDIITMTLKKEMEAGKIRTIPFDEIFATVFGLLFSPYLLNPLLSEFWGKDDNKKQAFFDMHKEHVISLITLFLEPKQN